MPHPLNLTTLAATTQPALATVLFAHGYGCDQSMWRDVAQAVPQTRRLLFDWPGAGGADLDAYDAERHATLDGYADDLLALLASEDLHDVVYVGHSVAASIGALAAQRDPTRFRLLAMVSPSPCLINDPPDYIGGFDRSQVDGLIHSLAQGHADWSRGIAPLVMGNPDRPALSDRLADSFCAMDPEIALRWAQATFWSDIRDCIPLLTVPCLVMQCQEDALAPVSVGAWLHRHLPRSDLVQLQATGHCPHLSAPDEVAQVLASALGLRG